MSWSDDTRCLFCDGKLPLFRKLAQGQFCSKAHQESYWKEQDQLAVQVLHRTHDAMQAYRPAASIESILGPTAAPEPVAPKPVELERVPDLQWLQKQFGGAPIAPPASLIIAADPVEYEAHPRTEKPRSEAGSPQFQLNRLAGLLALRNVGIAPLPLEAPSAMAMVDAQLTVSSPAWMPSAVPGLPSGELAALDTSGSMLGAAGRELEIVNAPESVAFDSRPVRDLVHTASPQGDVFHQLEQQAFPLGETLLAITAPGMAGSRATWRDGGDWVAFPAVEVECPSSPEFALQPAGLSAGAHLLRLSTEAGARDCHVGLTGEIAPLEPRVAGVVMDNVRLQTVAAAESMADLMEHSACAPLLSLGTSEACGSVENPMNRPVSFQPFTPEFAMCLPDSQTRPVAVDLLEIRFRAERLLALHFVEPEPRRDLRLRPGFVAMPQQGDPLLPKSKLQPATSKLAAQGVPAGVLAGANPAQEQSMRRMASGVVNFWQHAPRDLKMLLFAVPLALGLAFHPSLPKVSVQAPQADTEAVTSRFQNVLDTQMASLRKTIADRAAVGLDENFRQGLDNWMSHSGSTTEWSFDQAGFVRPGRVALYQPSLGLTDYEFQFLGAVDKGALSWVARAVDFQNYYVVKLVVVKPGPIPEMGITRYAVIDGKAVDRVDTPVTFNSRTDSLYRVSMVMEGDHYSLVIQGQMIDSWKEPRLKRGGIGFFTNRGEQSRIGWVQITHQYDMLGRLFAYLAP